MDKKDLSKLKRVIGREDDTPVSKVASCYVDVEKKDTRYQKPESFHSLGEKEAIQFLTFFKKSLTGNLGTTAVEIDTRNGNVILEKLRKSELGNEDMIRDVCENITESVNMDDNYCVYIAYGAYDVPPDGERELDSEEVYNFILVMIQPCKMSKPGIKYDYPGNLFTDRRKDRMLTPPVISFLYPSFDKGHTDSDRAMCFIKGAKNREQYQDLVKCLFGVNIPTSVETQKEGFYNIMSAGFDFKLPYETVQNVYERLNDMKVDSSLSGEEVKLTAREIADIVESETDNDEVNTDEIKQQVEKYADCDFSIDNLAPKIVGLKTDKALIKFELQEVGSIKRQTIDGVDYFLIPADNATIEEMGIH